MTPEEQWTLDAIDAARRSGRPDALDPWGGFAEARRIALALRRRRDVGIAGVPIDGYSTHRADRLASDSLTR